MIILFRSLVLMAVIVGTSYYIDQSQEGITARAGAAAAAPSTRTAVDTLSQLGWPLQGRRKRI